jgi:hypothetical protein
VARSSAEARLIRILTNEDYGPKLARLRGDEERYILRLIDQNKGKEARREILRLDEERRARERARREATRSPPRTSIRGPTRKERERRAIANILRIVGGKANRKRVTVNVSYMTDEELDFATQSDFLGLARRAKLSPDRRTVTGNDLNPFWYH